MIIEHSIYYTVAGFWLVVLIILGMYTGFTKSFFVLLKNLKNNTSNPKVEAISETAFNTIAGISLIVFLFDKVFYYSKKNISLIEPDFQYAYLIILPGMYLLIALSLIFVTSFLGIKLGINLGKNNCNTVISILTIVTSIAFAVFLTVV